MTHRLSVDLSNCTAWLTDGEGRTLLAWSEVTRRTALPIAAAAGWRTVGDQQLMDPPDGVWWHAEPCFS